jgi:hypothetical protein
MESNRQPGQIIKPFYQYLIDLRSNKKVAITDCIGKMITMLNTTMRNAEEWRMHE